MDYDLDILKIAVYSYYVQNGGRKVKLATYAAELHQKYDGHIVSASQQAGRQLTAAQRTVVAVMASVAPGGTAPACAQIAVQAFFQMQGW